jgi:hypothetical protein
MWTTSGHIDGFLDVLLKLRKSQLESYLPHGDPEYLIIFPIRNAVPGENKPWDRVTGYERTAPRRRVNDATISQHVQIHAPASTRHAARLLPGYGRGSMNAPLDPNLGTSSVRPQSLETDSMNNNMSFNPNLGLACQAAEDIWNPSLDSPWILPQQTSTTFPSLQIGLPQLTFNSIPYDFVPTFMNLVPWGSTEPLGSGMQASTTGSDSQGYHLGRDALIANFGIDPGQGYFNEDPSTFLPSQQDSLLPNLEFNNDLQRAEIWMMTPNPPVSDILNFNTADIGSSSMPDMSPDFERQLMTMQVSPYIQSQGRNDSMTLAEILEGSLEAENGVGFERSDIGECGLGADKENQE